jgi:hypothetical protein
MKVMQHATINTSYYCERPKVNGPVQIFTTGAYRVGEFDERNGDFHWHRLVPAPQKAIIENWFRLRFPYTAALEAAPESEAPAPTKTLTRHARA